MNRDPRDQARKFLIFHTYADHVMDQTLDPQMTAEFLVEKGLFNGIMMWVDHHKKLIPPPPLEWLKKNNLTVLFEFYTNDHYAVPCAKMEGFGENLTAYNEWWCGKILEYLHALGPDRSYWCLGHEHYDSFDQFPRMDPDGQVRIVAPQTRHEGFEVYRRWITTNEHQRHWGPHRYPTLPGYRAGRMTDQSDTLEFLRRRGQSIPHGLILGGVDPQHAHYQFEIFPGQEAFWWECMIPGRTNVQVGMSFLRGACRQYGRKSLADVAPYEGKRAYHDDLEQQKPLAQEFLNALSWTSYDEQGKKLAGYSESLHFRVWMSLWTGGVDMMLHEDSISTHFIAFGRKAELSPLGRAHARFADLALHRACDRGTLISTAAVVLPFLHGQCPPSETEGGDWPGHYRPWKGMEPTVEDWTVARFFNAAFPKHGRTFPWPYPGNPYDKNDLPARRHYTRLIQSGADLRALEPLHVTSSRWGNGIDVLLSNVRPDVLQSYPALILLGNFDSDPDFAAHLLDYVKKGGRVLVPSDFPNLMDLGFARQNYEALQSKKIGDGEIWVVALGSGIVEARSSYRFSKTIFDLLDNFLEPHCMAKINGPNIEWSLARNKQGLRLYLANHSPIDALPVVEIHPEKCGLAIAPETKAQDWISGCDFDIESHHSNIAIEVLVPAWGTALLDIPTRNIQQL